MQLMRFRVYTAPDPQRPDEATTVAHDLLVMPADRMRAERASTTELPPAQRGPKATSSHPETWVLLWLWCAATRLGLTADKFPAWAATVVDYDRLDADGQAVADDTAPAEVVHPSVDPTTGTGPTL